MQKLNIGKQKPKTVIINSLNNLNKDDLPILILISIFHKSFIDITIINANAYYTTYKLKKAQVFTVFIKDLEF